MKLEPKFKIGDRVRNIHKAYEDEAVITNISIIYDVSIDCTGKNSLSKITRHEYWKEDVVEKSVDPLNAFLTLMDFYERNNNIGIVGLDKHEVDFMVTDLYTTVIEKLKEK